MSMTFGGLRALVSAIGARFGISNSAGLTFGGARDLYAALGYDRELNSKKYRDRYKRNGIAARVVEAAPKATWRGGLEVIEDENPEVSTQFENAFHELNDRLNVWSVMCRADVLAGLGQYSVILIGAPGPLDTELPPTFKAEQLTYLTPFAQEDAQIQTYDENPESERFGLPEFYTLSRLSGTKSKTVGKKVHWSRIIHIADGALDDCVLGLPRLERVWNWLDDLDKVTGAGSEAFWIRANQGLIVNLDKELSLGEDETKEKEAVEAMKEKMDEFMHGLRRTLLTRGSDITPLGSDVAPFNTQVDAIITLISGATGIPKRILVGSERGELASTQDRENWNERITDRRNDFAAPYIIRPFIDILIEHGALPEPTEYTVRWPEINKLTETEKAAVAEKLAGLNSKAGDVVITAPEIRDRVLMLPPLTEEQLADIEEQELEEQERLDQEEALLEEEAAARGEQTPPKDQTPPKAASGKGSPRLGPGHSRFVRSLTVIAGGSKR